MIRLDHIAIATRDARPLLGLLERLIDLVPYRHEGVEREGVETVFLPTGRTKLELLRPLRDDSPISRFLEKRDSGIHHLAFEVSNIQDTLEKARSLGLTPLTDTALPGADGKLIFFLHPRDTYGVLIEFCQQERTVLLSQDLDVAGHKLKYYRGGSRQADSLLLIHGELGGIQIDFGSLIPALERRFDVISLEGGGNGQSPAAGDLLPTHLLVAALDALQVDSTFVLGYSAGGANAIEMALGFADRVRGVALFGVGHSDEGEISVTEPAAGDLWSKAVFSSESALRKKAWAKIARSPLDQLRSRILVMGGDRDPFCPVEDVVALYRRLNGSSLVIFAEADHDLLRIDPEHLLDSLIKWCSLEGRFAERHP